MLNFSLEVMSAKVGAHVRLNGFGVLSATSGGRQYVATQVGGFLTEGANRVEIALEAVPPPPALDDDPFFDARFSAVEMGSPLQDSDVFLGAGWAPDARLLAPEGLTKILDHTFHLAKAPGAWRFLQAPEMAAPARAAADTLTALATALRSKKLDVVRQLFAMRFTELALAADVPREEAEDALLMPLGELMSESAFEVHAATAEGLELESAFGGRVTHVRGRGGRAPLAMRVGLRELALPFSIAEIDGVATIIR